MFAAETRSVDEGAGADAEMAARFCSTAVESISYLKREREREVLDKEDRPLGLSLSYMLFRLCWRANSSALTSFLSFSVGRAP